MSKSPPKVDINTAHPKKSTSGEHEAVQAFRKKAESIDEQTMPLLAQLHERIDRVVGHATPSVPVPTPIPTLSSLPPTVVIDEKELASMHRGRSWAITIHGMGTHHTFNPEDANRMAAQFVKELREKGHTVTYASITVGGEDILLDPDRYFAEHAPKEENKP